MSMYDRLELDGFHFYYSGREGDYFKHNKLPLKGTASGGHLTVYNKGEVMFQASLSRDGADFLKKVDAFFDEFEKANVKQTRL